MYGHRKIFNMSYFRKTLERRTFSQDRYYILIKRQKAGTATLSELTELDEIVNRVPDIREKVLRENFEEFTDAPRDTPPGESPHDGLDAVPVRKNLWSRIKAVLREAFVTNTCTVPHKISAIS